MEMEDFTPVGETTNEMVSIEDNKESVNDVKAFWERQRLVEHERAHKRGFMLYGRSGVGISRPTKRK